MTAQLNNRPGSVLSTGVIQLDFALGSGGLPRGEIVEIFGGPSCGKTTLALTVVAEAGLQGLTCLYLDLERGIALSYAHRCGVDPEKVYFGYPECGEDALEYAYLALSSGGFEVVVLDTIAALCPRQQSRIPTAKPAGWEINRVLEPYLRRLKTACRHRAAVLICLNQLRTRLKAGYGTPETSPGGIALKNHSAVRLRLDRLTAPIRDPGIPEEHIQVSILKNNQARTRSTFFDIVYNMGIDRENPLVSLGIKENIIYRAGSQYLFRESPLGRTPSEIADLLRSNRMLRQQIRSDLSQQLLPTLQQ